MARGRIDRAGSLLVDAPLLARDPARPLTMGDSRQGVLTGLHILVVEDDVDSREILKSLLGYFGALVTVRDGVADAVRELMAIAPDLVIADMILGQRSSGLGLIAEARRRGSKAPFIAISGQDYDPRELEQAGFAAYLRKPLDHNKLIDTILTVVRKPPGTGWTVARG